MRKYLTPQLLAFVLLTGAISYAMNESRVNARDGRVALATEIRQVLLQGCERTNELRGGIRAVLLASEKRNQNLRINTPAQAEASKIFYDAQKPKFKEVNCKAVYPEPGSGE